MERADWLEDGVNTADARFLMVTAITHHRFNSPIWGAREVRKLQAELAEITKHAADILTEHQSKGVTAVVWATARQISARTAMAMMPRPTARPTGEGGVSMISSAAGRNSRSALWRRGNLTTFGPGKSALGACGEGRPSVEETGAL